MEDSPQKKLARTAAIILNGHQPPQGLRYYARKLVAMGIAEEENRTVFNTRSNSTLTFSIFSPLDKEALQKIIEETNNGNQQHLS